MPIPVRCAGGRSAQGAGPPGRQVGGRGITWGGTGRDIVLTLMGGTGATMTCSGPPRPRYALAP